MQTRWMPFLMIALLVASRTSAGAQSQGQVQDNRQAGLTMGYPASIGLLWHVTDKVALRPEFSVSRTSVDASSSGIIGTSTTVGTSSTVDGWSYGVGVSGLFYMRQWDSLRTYVAPRFAYTRSTLSTSSSSALSLSSDNTSRSYSVVGSFGAQYSLGRRFAVFGETGLGYTDSKASSGASASTFHSETDTHAWSTRTGVGVILYS